MKIIAVDYAPLKGFYGWMTDRFMTMPPGLAPEDHPLAVLERFEERSMAMARNGLALALGDILEDTGDLPPEQVLETDSALAAQGLPSLSEVRARLGRVVGGILGRGKVRDEREYYALRNAVELLSEDQQSLAWQLLGEFENRICPEKDLRSGS